ncbi:ZPR1 zinc-finger domain-containing protein [Pisolithus croceorrhizus]|nr:ZPR1 zinc-finger domain-containing protein [Pisolithus croceorrhizus]
MHCRDTGFRTARGQLTTSEGLLRDITADLSSGQPVRRIMDEAAYTKIQQIIDGFKEVLGDEEEVEDEADEAGQVSSATEKNKDPVKKAITIKLDDLSGNSFAEFLGSISDPKWTFKTRVQREADGEGAGDTNVEIYEFMGSVFAVCASIGNSPEKIAVSPSFSLVSTFYLFPEGFRDNFKVRISLETDSQGNTEASFKDTLIMSTNCEHCGYRDNEVKSSAAISEGKENHLEDRGTRRFKQGYPSETCDLTIPNRSGLAAWNAWRTIYNSRRSLEQVYEELSEKVYAAGSSSTMVDEDRQKFQDFLKQLEEITNTEKPFTLILDDPLANSYLQNLYAPYPDLNMEIVTLQQNEELQLNDMKVDNYIVDNTNEPKEEKRFEQVAS